MKTRFPLLRAAASVALVASGFLAAPAMANITPGNVAVPPDSIYLKYSGSATYGGYETFTTGTGSIAGVANPLHGGGIRMLASVALTGENSYSFDTYCVQISQWTPGSWQPYTLGNFGSAQVSNALANLYDIAGGSALSSSTLAMQQKSAAFQAAVWEITHETSGTYSLTGADTGGFFGTFGSNLITDQANSWLSSVNSLGGAASTSYLARTYTNGQNQDLLVITSVPEPGTYALMLAGLGLMATIARRRGRSVE